jgi:hypothetical protein
MISRKYKLVFFVFSLYLKRVLCLVLFRVEVEDEGGKK